MNEDSFQSDYNGFMKWFARNYPALCKRHTRNILMPTDGEGVIISRVNIDASTFSMLSQLARDYYYLSKIR